MCKVRRAGKGQECKRGSKEYVEEKGNEKCNRIMNPFQVYLFMY
jgi:hypothetical protein